MDIGVRGAERGAIPRVEGVLDLTLYGFLSVFTLVSSQIFTVITLMIKG